jgi:hypothetical protein
MVTPLKKQISDGTGGEAAEFTVIPERLSDDSPVFPNIKSN